MAIGESDTSNKPGAGDVLYAGGDKIRSYDTSDGEPLFRLRSETRRGGAVPGPRHPSFRLFTISQRPIQVAIDTTATETVGVRCREQPVDLSGDVDVVHRRRLREGTIDVECENRVEGVVVHAHLVLSFGQVRLRHEVQPAGGERLLFCFLLDVELKFDLLLPVIGHEARIFEFRFEGVYVRVRERIRRQFVVDDVLRSDTDERASGVARYSERCAVLMDP